MSVRLLAVVGLALAGSGCSIIEYSTRNLICDPLHYHENGSRLVSKADFQQKAKELWWEIQAGSSDHAFSCDYEKGFVDGFVDYCIYGGNGEPPVMPPRTYWQNKYQTPEGHQAIQDWFTGFRHGALVAMEGGYRQYVPLPTSSSTGSTGGPGGNCEPAAPALPPEPVPVSTKGKVPSRLFLTPDPQTADILKGSKLGGRPELPAP